MKSLFFNLKSFEICTLILCYTTSKTINFFLLIDFPMKKCVSLFIMLCIVCIAFSQNIDYGNNASAGKYYNIKGIKMYCEIYGSGKPLLLIHGNGGSIKTFDKTIPYFSKKYKVIAVDSRSQGKSEDKNDSLSFEMMADDFAALLDTLHIDSAYVVGFSDGGINALLLAIRHSEKVIKFAATGANITPDSTAFAEGVWQEAKRYYDTSYNKTWKTKQAKNDWKLFLLDWNQPNITLEQLHTIKCPSLIICGDHDAISVEHTILIYKNIPQAYLWVLPNSGHGTLRRYAAEFTKKVDEFFSTPFHDHEWR